MTAVNKYGFHDWKTVATFVLNRNAMQCRRRWVDILCPAYIHAPWTEKEVSVLKMNALLKGPKWKELASNLPGRSGNAVKNKYHSLVSHGLAVSVSTSHKAPRPARLDQSTRARFKRKTRKSKVMYVFGGSGRVSLKYEAW